MSTSQPSGQFLLYLLAGRKVTVLHPWWSLLRRDAVQTFCCPSGDHELCVGQSAQVLQSHGDTGSWCHPMESGQSPLPPQLPLFSLSPHFALAAQLPRPGTCGNLGGGWHLQMNFGVEPVSELYVHFWEREDCICLLLRLWSHLDSSFSPRRTLLPCVGFLSPLMKMILQVRLILPNA